jgi:hypothetical protein
MTKFQQIRDKFPQYSSYNDRDFAAAIWNQYYKDKLPFEDFSARIGYSAGQIPTGVEPSMPAPPEAQPSKAGQVLRDVGGRIMENVQAVPALGALGGGLSFLSRLPQAGKTVKFLGQAAQPLLPKTGAELLAQTGKAAALAPVGVAGERLTEPVLQAAGQVVPLPQLREEEKRKALADVLRTPFGVGAEAVTGAGVGRGVAGAQRKLAQRPAAIPEERVEAARQIESLGGKQPAADLMRGSEISRNMGVFNKLYNKLVGNPESTTFGTNEFKTAKNSLSAMYESLLGGKTISFGPQFFKDIKTLLDKQRSLGETGVMFSESRPIINTLSQISNLPDNLRVRIQALRDIPPETTDINVTRNAMKVIDDSIAALQRQPEIKMDAKVYNELRSQLGDAAYQTGNKERASVLRKMQKAFDDAADKSLPKEVVDKLHTTRNRWENLQILEQAQKQSEPGLILPQQIGNVTRQRAGEGVIYGDKEIYDLGQKGLSLGMSPSGASRQLDPAELLPSKLGGPRQQLGIIEKATRAVTDPIRARQIIEGPVSPEEVTRKQALQTTRAAVEGEERELEKEKP